MGRKRNRSTEDANRMYVGMDLHKMYTQYAVIDNDGVLVKEGSGHSRRVLSDQGGHGMAERSWNQSVRTSLKGSSEDCYRRLSTGTGPSSRPSANSEDSHFGWLGWHHSENDGPSSGAFYKIILIPAGAVLNSLMNGLGLCPLLLE